MGLVEGRSLVLNTERRHDDGANVRLGENLS